MAPESSDFSEKIRQAVWAVTGTLLMGIGVWTATTLDQLSKAVIGLEKAMLLMQRDIEGMPPPDLLYQLEDLKLHLKTTELETRRLQQQIDVLEEWMRSSHPLSDKPATKPYAGKR